jgi:transposase
MVPHLFWGRWILGRITSAKPHLSEKEISERLKGTIGREHRRWLVIWNAVVDPRPAVQIARHIGVSVSTVHNVISLYNRYGPQAVEAAKQSKRRRCYLSKEEEALFLERFLEQARAGEMCVAGCLKRALEDHLGHDVHHSTVYRMLKRNKWRKVVPRPAHPESNERIQEDFKKNIPQLVSGILRERDPWDTRPAVIMTQDEGRFGRISDARSCWAPKGIRPKIPRQIVRAFVYVYAAVCMAMGKMTSLILPYANTDMMNVFLEEVSKDFKDYFVIMMVDGAGWHRSEGLKIPENIRLIYQPSHSPELNPVEHLWEELREKHFSNKAFRSLDAVEQALCEGLSKLHDDPERLRSMTNFRYLQVTI